jgi:pimeloyl-ACP methyl ester carboxylesterase
MSTTFENAATKSFDVNGTNFVYREIGKKAGIPVVFLHHLTAVLEDWDPRVVDGLAATHHVVLFDNRGVGGSGGSTPKTVEEMARDAAAFIGALGFSKVDLLGFSLGGFVAQVIAQQQPGLVRKIILAGTGPAGGEGIANVGAVLQDAFGKAGAANKHPKHFLFFTQTSNGQAAADEFLLRLKERTKDVDTPVSNETVQAQITAIHTWGQGDATALGTVQHPVLIVNGDDDVMVPTVSSFALARKPGTVASSSTMPSSFSRHSLSSSNKQN